MRLGDAIFNKQKHIIMTTNTYRKRSLATPSLDHMVSSFFNSAIRDVINSAADKKRTTRPAVNVSSREDKYILDIALPGLSKSDIDINVEEEVLTVSDKREIDTESDPSYRLREFNYAGFSKSFRIPEDIDIDNISASFKHGILTITLNKKEEALPRPPKTIAIK